MTCIVAAVDTNTGFSIIGGDRCATEESGIITTSAESKVKRFGDSLWGYAGHCAAEQLIEHLFQEPKGNNPLKWFREEFASKAYEALKTRGWQWTPDSHEFENKYGVCMIVVYNSQIYSIEESLEVNLVGEDYFSIGSGQSLALGALHACKAAGVNIVKACECALSAASTHEPHVDKPFDFLTVE